MESFSCQIVRSLASGSAPGRASSCPGDEHSFDTVPALLRITAGSFAQLRSGLVALAKGRQGQISE